MTHLILLTAVLRTDNLFAIADNIIERFKNETEISPVWCICFDKYNADISPIKVKKLEVKLLENNITYALYYQGEEGKENYGGALFNSPLLDLKRNSFQTENPLVYILDDDNILHYNLLPFIKKYALDNEKSWWLNMLDEFGTQRFVRNADRLAFIKGTGKNEGYNVIHPCSSCDPSQILIRLDKILEIGGFGNDKFYDYDFMNKIFVNQNDLDSTMNHQGTLTWMRNKDFLMTCNHNGLVTKETINESLKSLEEASEDMPQDSYIRIHIGDQFYILPLDNSELKSVLKYYNSRFCINN